MKTFIRTGAIAAALLFSVCPKSSAISWDLPAPYVYPVPLIQSTYVGEKTSPCVYFTDIYEFRTYEQFDEYFSITIPAGKKLLMDPYVYMDNTEEISIYEVNQTNQVECRRTYYEWDNTPYISTPTAKKIYVRLLKNAYGPSAFNYLGAYFSWTFSDL
jgi:hypothetical protein